jgi:Putative zinc ribbon domain
MTTDTLTCDSCGMPLATAEDHALADVHSRYCKYCVNPDGQVQDFDERFERMLQWAIKRDGLDHDAAVEKTRAYMRTMPAWRQHPALAD